MIKRLFEYLLRRMTWLLLLTLIGASAQVFAFTPQGACPSDYIYKSSGTVYQIWDGCCNTNNTGCVDPRTAGSNGTCVKTHATCTATYPETYQSFTQVPTFTQPDNATCTGSGSSMSCTCNEGYTENNGVCEQDAPPPDPNDCQAKTGTNQGFSWTAQTDTSPAPSFHCDSNGCQYNPQENFVAVCLGDNGTDCYGTYTATGDRCNNIQIPPGTGQDSGDPSQIGSQEPTDNGSGVGSSSGGQGSSSGSNNAGPNGANSGNASNGSGSIDSDGDGNPDGTFTESDKYVEFDNVPYVPSLGTHDFDSNLNSTPFGGSGGCPADVVTSTSKGSLTFSYQPTCDFVLNLKPIVILISLIVATLIIAYRKD